jgi:SNF2 family DNA or RNA helicase
MEELAKLCPYRLILNGTPISKNEADLYQQWKILDGRILGYSSFWSFARNHLEYDQKYRHKVRRVLNIDYITDKISPYAYMVKKEDVLNLPGKNYSCKSFSMGMYQEAHYDTQMDRFLATLIDGDDEAAIYRTFTVLQEITSGRRIVSDTDEPLKHEPFYARTEDNPRIRALMETVAESPEEKTVIWCKFQHEADDIISVLAARYGGGTARMLTGKLSPKARDESIRAFRDGGARFLVANKTCAGYGLNLQFCHRAIYYDNDWSWATRAQSEDRIHRIGQDHDVEIIDLCCAHSIDQRILDCLARKTRIADNFRAAVKGKNARQWLKGKDVEEAKDG